jgi:hypothetical protein
MILKTVGTGTITEYYLNSIENKNFRCSVNLLLLNKQLLKFIFSEKENANVKNPFGTGSFII